MNRPDELELMLARALRDRADPLHGLGFGIDEVKGRAHQIRRTRRVVAGAIVAAGLAVAVPIAIAAGDALQSQRDIEPAPSPTPHPVVRTTLTLEGLEQGDPPAIEYFSPEGLFLPSEGLQPEVRYQAIVANPGTDGWIGMEALGKVISLDESFELTCQCTDARGLDTTPDRAWVTWVNFDNDLQTLVLRSTTDPAAGMTWDLPDGRDAAQVGFVGPDRVVYNRASRPFIAEPDGSHTEVAGYRNAISANPTTGLLAVLAKADGPGCFAVLDPDTAGEPLWETCDYVLGAFSPDGRLVMGGLDQQPGVFGVASLDLLDARTGAVVAQFRQPADTELVMSGPVWESDDALLAVALEGPTTAMVRLSMDGSIEEVADRGPEAWDQDVYYYFGMDRQSFFGR